MGTGKLEQFIEKWFCSTCGPFVARNNKFQMIKSLQNFESAEDLLLSMGSRLTTVRLNLYDVFTPLTLNGNNDGIYTKNVAISPSYNCPGIKAASF